MSPGDEKRVNIIVKAIVTLQDEDVPTYFVFVLFRTMIMTSLDVGNTTIKKKQDFLEPVKCPLHVRAYYSPLLFSHQEFVLYKCLILSQELLAFIL